MKVVRTLVLSFTVLALVLSQMACSGKGEQKQTGGQAQGAQRGGPGMPVPVTIAAAVQKDVPLSITSIGTVEAYNTVGIKPQVGGEIKAVNFTEGQDVKKGQTLFTIDARPAEADLRRAEATLAKDMATAANDKAQATRYEALYKEGVVSKQVIDQMITAANASEALVKADHAAVENARVQLQYTTIYAPVSGRTGNLMVQLGNVVKANPDNPLVTINQITPIYVTFMVPEQFLSDVKRYQGRGKLKVSAAIPNDPNPALGTLSFIDNAVDKQTGTIKLKGTFENGDRRLWPGQFVNVTLVLSTQPNAITVPTQAVQTGQQGQFVFVVKDDNTAELRTVQVARGFGDESVVNGVQPGERVVTDGQLRLVPGAKVDIRPTNGPAPASGTGSPAANSNQQALR